MQNFRTYHLSIKFYKAIAQLKMNPILKNQLLRASSSVTLNLMEGNYRQGRKDRIRFFNIAYSSSKECFAVFELADIQNQELIKLNDHLSASIFKLMP